MRSLTLTLISTFILSTCFSQQDTLRGLKINGVQFTEVFTYADGTPMVNKYIDSVIYIKVQKDFYKRDFTTAIQATWFGITGSIVQLDCTDEFIKAFKAQQIHRVILDFPYGYISPTKLITTQVGLMMSDINFRGKGKFASTLFIPNQINFRGSISLKNMGFEGVASKYMFYFPRSLDTVLVRYIYVDNCNFNTFRIPINIFNVDSTFQLKWSGYFRNSTYENIGAIAIFLRYKTDGLRISNCIFKNPINKDEFQGTIILGDKTDVWNSRGVVVTRCKFYELYNPETDGVEIHNVLAYSNKNVFSYNYFYNCRRAMYSRGDAGIIEHCTVINDDPKKYGVLPFIFKGGVGGNHIMRDNDIRGYFTGVVDIDDQETGAFIQRNKMRLTMVGDNPKAIWYISSGTKGYTDKQDLIISDNNIVASSDSNYTLISVEAPMHKVVIEGNRIEDSSKNRIGRQFISGYTTTGIDSLIIRNNPFLSVPSLAITNAHNRVIDSNIFYFRNVNYGGWYKVTGGISETATNNKFIMYPNVTADYFSFSRLWVFDGTGTKNVEHKDFYVQGNNVPTSFYWFNNSDSMNVSIDSFFSGNTRLANFSGKGFINAKINNSNIKDIEVDKKTNFISVLLDGIEVVNLKN